MDNTELRRFAAEARKRVRVIEQAIEAGEALRWFDDYGKNLASCGRDGASVRVHLNYAASTAWVDRAQAYLDRAANEALPEIVARAILLAEVDHNAGRPTSQETDHAE